jgi:hypothetical protein
LKVCINYQAVPSIIVKEEMDKEEMDEEKMDGEEMVDWIESFLISRSLVLLYKCAESEKQFQMLYVCP